MEEALTPVSQNSNSPTRPEIDLLSLTAKQQEAVHIINSGKNIFITGGAGTGKSHILTYLEQSKSIKQRLVKLAPVGVSAANIEGRTYHSFFKFHTSKNNKKIQSYTELAHNNVHFIENNISLKENDVLVFDEISMISGESLDLMDYICKIKLKNEKPFGGLQVIFIGDFFQLPPICNKKFALCDNAVSSRGYAFNSCVWNDMDLLVIHLTETKRQSDDVLFFNMLEKIRKGNHDKAEVTEYFSKNTISNLDDTIVDSNEQIKISKLECVKKEINKENKRELDLLPGNLEKYVQLKHTADNGAAIDTHRGQQCDDDDDDDDDQSNLKLKQISLKIGAQVMLTKNFSFEPPYLVNGSRGVVTDFVTIDIAIKEYEEELELIKDQINQNFQDKSSSLKSTKMRLELSIECAKSIKGNYKINQVYPKVLFENKISKIILPCKLKEFFDVENKVHFYFLTIPLELAWYISVHKSQGLSLSKVEVNLTDVFCDGQVYVALSRATSLHAIRIKGFKVEDIKVSQIVKKADEKDYRNCEKWKSTEDYRKLFIKSDASKCVHCGGNSISCQEQLGSLSQLRNQLDKCKQKLGVTYNKWLHVLDANPNLSISAITEYSRGNGYPHGNEMHRIFYEDIDAKYFELTKIDCLHFIRNIAKAYERIDSDNASVNSTNNRSGNNINIHPYSNNSSKRRFETDDVDGHVYVLRLEGGKYYVGQSKNKQRRIDAHKDGKGADFTKTYRVIDDETPMTSPMKELNTWEEIETLKQMHKHGIDNVRGSTWCNIVLTDNDKMNIKNRMSTALNLCYKCNSNQHQWKDCKK